MKNFKVFIIERNNLEWIKTNGMKQRIPDIISYRYTLAEAQEEHKLVCIANDDLKYANIRSYEDETEAEAFTMFHNGMNLLTAKQFLNQIKHLGYKLNTKKCFDYFNSGNERKYKARCMSNYICISNGLGFANINNPEDENFKLLQEMRKTCFCYENGRIWEL